jgi:hypothetical protein
VNILYILLLARVFGVWGSEYNTTLIIIISPPQSTAGHRPLQSLAISLDLQLLASSSRRPSCVNCHYTSTWPEGVVYYVYRVAVSTPELVYPSGSTADIASPLPLQHGNTMCYIGDLSSLPDQHSDRGLYRRLKD